MDYAGLIESKLNAGSFAASARMWQYNGVRCRKSRRTRRKWVKEGKKQLRVLLSVTFCSA